MRSCLLLAVVWLAVRVHSAPELTTTEDVTSQGVTTSTLEDVASERDIVDATSGIYSTEQQDDGTTETELENTVNDVQRTEVITTVQSTRGPKKETISPLLLSMHLQTNAPKLQCGRRVARNARIVGGMDSFEGEFPWAVSVRLLTTHYCGGTIINKLWILTAAHCVKRYNARYFRVRPGGREVHLDEGRPEWDIHVQEVSVHPDFGHPRRYSNDLALLKLKRPIPFGEVAQPICLPRTLDEDYEGRNATVVGWGWLNEVEKGKSKRLQKVQVPVLNNTICAQWYSDEYNGYVQIHDYQICAGYKEGGKDSCQGDSGGPLVMKDKDHFTLIGVVSAGVGCARKHLPGIYSRVSVFVPWIIEVTGGLYGP